MVNKLWYVHIIMIQVLKPDFRKILNSLGKNSREISINMLIRVFIMNYHCIVCLFFYLSIFYQFFKNNILLYKVKKVKKNKYRKKLKDITENNMI